MKKFLLFFMILLIFIVSTYSENENTISNQSERFVRIGFSQGFNYTLLNSNRDLYFPYNDHNKFQEKGEVLNPLFTNFFIIRQLSNKFIFRFSANKYKFEAGIKCFCLDDRRCIYRIELLAYEFDLSYLIIKKYFFKLYSGVGFSLNDLKYSSENNIIFHHNINFTEDRWYKGVCTNVYISLFEDNLFAFHIFIKSRWVYISEDIRYFHTFIEFGPSIKF